MTGADSTLREQHEGSPMQPGEKRLGSGAAGRPDGSWNIGGTEKSSASGGSRMLHALPACMLRMRWERERTGVRGSEIKSGRLRPRKKARPGKGTGLGHYACGTC